jgi:hypothetical protein
MGAHRPSQKTRAPALLDCALRQRLAAEPKIGHPHVVARRSNNHSQPKPKIEQEYAGPLAGYTNFMASEGSDGVAEASSTMSA